MTEESPDDIFETKAWLYKAITDPYQVFAEAFSTACIGSFRKFIKNIMHYAEATEIYSEKSPCDILLFMRIIRSLIKASDNLKEIKNGPIIVSESEAFNKKYFRSHYVTSNDWEDFPHFLSMKEFCNPYKVFRKFFKYQDLDAWVHDLEETVDAALSKCNGELGLEMIVMYSHLVKLAEAAHLINVREVTHIGGILKNRGN
ncbi:MAG: hypothetical protein ACTHM5_12935 [Ginsengibacter sp.]